MRVQPPARCGLMFNGISTQFVIYTCRLGVGTVTSIGMLLYSFPTIWGFDYAFKARRNLTNWVRIEGELNAWIYLGCILVQVLYWWLGGVCAVHLVQIPLRLKMQVRYCKGFAFCELICRTFAF